jgi:hypothetical protein
MGGFEIGHWELYILGLAALVAMLSAGTAGASPHYYCYRTTKRPQIDGKMQDADWKAVPWLEFREIATGAAPPFVCRAKLLWDDQYLYVGMEAKDTDVWATLGADTPPPTQYAAIKTGKEQFIMLADKFFKVFLDPDADGKNYLEFHVNANGLVNDAWVEHGASDSLEKCLDPYAVHYQWHCAGLQRAVHVAGTVNQPDDTDRGWSLEMAIPWSALATFSIGACPPQPGDVWKAHLGYVWKPAPKGENRYYTWPVLGVVDCHQLDRYGYIRFSDRPAAHEKAAPNQLEWKMVWIWSMGDKSDAETISLAKSLGFNVVSARDKAMVEECHRQGVQALGALWMSSAPKEFAQVMRPEEDDWLKKLANPTEQLFQEGGEPIRGGEVWAGQAWCLDRPEALAYGKEMIDKFIRDGYDGIALDAVGYSNHYACFCPVSLAKQQEYAHAHPELAPAAARLQYSDQALVNFCTKLVAYAKAQKPGIVVTCHIYPYFAPNPLYGNRIPIDYCGQTVSWFFHPYWGMDKVERYAYEVAQAGNAYHSNSIGAPFLGIYTLPPFAMHHKPAARVREELRAIKRAGARALQIAELGNILNDPEIAQVVKEELTEK